MLRLSLLPVLRRPVKSIIKCIIGSSNSVAISAIRTQQLMRQTQLQAVALERNPPETLQPIQQLLHFPIRLELPLSFGPETKKPFGRLYVLRRSGILFPPALLLRTPKESARRKLRTWSLRRDRDAEDDFFGVCFRPSCFLLECKEYIKAG